jgi:pre-mRNA cleavage complex 2 protein Pcf11
VVINFLTMLAGQYAAHAPVVARAIEAKLLVATAVVSLFDLASSSHKAQSEPERGLPCLYLIDSILKNENGPYMAAFTESIELMFCRVYEMVGLWA